MAERKKGGKSNWEIVREKKKWSGLVSALAEEYRRKTVR